jgi:hypothetical protein
MSILIPSLRSTVAVPSWAKNELWRRARAVPSLDQRFAESKSLVDAVSGQNLITFTRASDGAVVNSAGQIEIVAANVPRFDHDPVTGESLGLLPEEQRTNSIRNNTMVGAVAGTPGTLPTNWARFLGGTAATSVIGSGTENGISYVDVRFTGGNGGAVSFFIDGTAPAIASNGQAWTGSAYYKLVAGSFINAGVTHVVYEANATPVSLAASSTSLVSISNGPLISQRVSVTRTNNQATTAFEQLAIVIAATGSFDFTLRIGLPQLEQGAFATSVIPTSGTAVTRSADVASITGDNFSRWYRQDEGSAYWEGSRRTTTGFPDRFRFSDGTNANRWFNYWDSAGNSSTFEVFTGSVGQVGIFGGGSSLNTTGKAAFGMAADNAAAVYDGVVRGTDASVTVPVVSQLTIGQNFTGTIRRITYWPQRLPNSTLQNITL